MSIIITFVVIAVIISLLFKSVNKDRKPTDKTDKKEPYSGNQKQGNHNYGKWIGGGLGWAFGGPLGAIIGFALGSHFGNKTNSREYVGQTSQQRDFNVSLLVRADLLPTGRNGL